jgi:hypothetical protein
MPGQDQICGEVQHPDEAGGATFVSDGYSTKVLQRCVSVTRGAPAFVRSSNHFRFADHSDKALSGFTPVEIGRSPLSTAPTRATVICIRRACARRNLLAARELADLNLTRVTSPP